MINPFLYFLLLFKASLFSTGGFSNLPSIHQDFTAEGWAAGTDFGEAIAIGQVSPGPNGLWVVSLGYISYGPAGAVLALLAVTFPALLVLVIAGIYARIERHRRVTGLMRGVSLAVVGILATVCWTILHTPGIDWTGWLFAGAAFALGTSRRVPLVVILCLAATAGILLYHTG